MSDRVETGSKAGSIDWQSLLAMYTEVPAISTGMAGFNGTIDDKLPPELEGADAFVHEMYNRYESQLGFSNEATMPFATGILKGVLMYKAFVESQSSASDSAPR